MVNCQVGYISPAPTNAVAAAARGTGESDARHRAVADPGGGGGHRGQLTPPSVRR